MTTILDTHFLIWLTLRSSRLSEFPWLERYRPWGILPISLLEIQYLAEIGRIEVYNPEFTEQVLTDERFIVDDVPFLSLIRHAIDIAWTRDPFDRLLTAHSASRRLPLCTTDRLIRTHHPLIVAELRSKPKTIR